MAWTTPITFASGNVLRGAQMNTYVRDNTAFLHDPPMTRLVWNFSPFFPVPTGTETAVGLAADAVLGYQTDAGMHSSAVGDFGSQLVVSTAGVYLFVGWIEWEIQSSSGIRRCRIISDAGNVAAMATDGGPSASAFSQQTVIGSLKLAAGQSVQLFAFQNSGSDNSVTGRLSAQWLGSGT